MSDELMLRGPRAHSVALMLDDEWLDGKVTCHATEGADCRVECPEGCEEWNLADHEHELIDSGRCLFAEWLENQGPLSESHVGSRRRRMHLDLLYAAPHLR